MDVGHVQEGNAILKDDPTVNEFVNELFDSDFVDPSIGGSTTDLHDAYVPGNVVPPDPDVAPKNKSDVVVHDDLVLNSGDAANFESEDVDVAVFAADAVGGPMHPVLAELNEWFDGNDDGADSMRRGQPHSLPIKRASGGSDHSRTKRARSINTNVPMREAKHTWEEQP
ncbi:hypothetical protein V6N13_074710 [Hibiscus sabdariffa]